MTKTLTMIYFTIIILSLIALFQSNYLTFTGDNYRLIEATEKALIIGSKNMVFNISLDTFELNAKIEWISDENNTNLCIIKGMNGSECQNFINILTKNEKGEVFICGTYAYNPKCAIIINNEIINETENNLLSSYNPNENSILIYVDEDIYAASFAGILHTQSFLRRKGKHQLITDQFNTYIFQKPKFISLFDYGEYVYILFEEVGVESIHTDHIGYPRIARVCKNDNGSYINKNNWTSFIKTRLTCSNNSIHFNRLQSTSKLINGNYNNISFVSFYGIFTTSFAHLFGSAICMFSLHDIDNNFNGKFKDSNSMLPISISETPKPRPGICVNNSQNIPQNNINFIKTNPMMDKIVHASFYHPITTLIDHYKFNVIAVDEQILATDNKSYDIIFIGTNNGMIIKGFNYNMKFKSIDSMQIFDSHMSIINLKIINQQLIIVTDTIIKSIPLYTCGLKLTCSKCIGNPDPYCAWDINDEKCTHLKYYVNSSFIQNLNNDFDICLINPNYINDTDYSTNKTNNDNDYSTNKTDNNYLNSINKTDTDTDISNSNYENGKDKHFIICPTTRQHFHTLDLNRCDNLNCVHYLLYLIYIFGISILIC